MRSRVLHIVAVSLLAYGPAGCKRSEPAAPKAPPPSLLLITLDTTRADRLGCYGYKAAQTPALDALAASGVRFERAFTPVPLTLPAHVSLLTGTYPPTNGVRINGTTPLGDGIETLAEVLRAAGYHTGAFVSAAALDSSLGLARGFDIYDDQFGPSDAGTGAAAERRADQVCSTALAWLDELTDAPFFAWVHFYDPHHPYEPPEPFRGHLSDPYDGEIAFTDSQVARLLDWLVAAKRRDHTLVVAVGDHGEAFEEHGETQHGLFVYATTMQVPLIISLPSALPQPRVISADVGLIDVFPTIIELLGSQPRPGVEGISLAGACRTGSVTVRPIYGESYYSRLAYGWAALRSITTREWKYINAPRPELYDRLVDAGELTNVAADRPSVTSELRAELQVVSERMVPRGGQVTPPDPETIKRLETLGYLAGGTTAPDIDEIGSGRDPKDMIGAYRAHMRALRQLGKGHLEAAITIMEPLVRESPESSQFHATLGRAYLDSGRAGEAQASYETALRSDPDNADWLCALGDAYRRQRKNAQAIETYKRALASAPGYGQAHSRLGLAYAGQQKFAEAHHHFRRHVEINPKSPNALSNLGNILLALRRPDEAVTLLRTALTYDPRYAPAHQALWRALLAANRLEETIQALRKAREMVTGNHDLTMRLAWILATTTSDDLRSPAEALQLAREVCQSKTPSADDLDVLAAALAATGDFAAATETAHRALVQADAEGNTNVAAKIRSHIHLFEKELPCR